jgi:TetR/AcrR family transcriptional regulator, ethionamide resistance regulator
VSAAVDPLPDRGRRTRKPTGDDRERAILETAERLLESRALRDISVDDLARGAGISRSTFYFYFPSKESVVLTLLDRVAEEARALRLAALESSGDDARTIWRRALVAIHGTFRSHRTVTLAAAQLFFENDEARELWSRVMEGFVSDTTAAIEMERARGAAPGGPPARDLAIALNWMNERVFHASYAAQDPIISEENVLDVLLSIWSRAIYRTDYLTA